MKKLFILICMTLISASSFAQQGRMDVGIHGNYMLDSPNNVGIGANLGYEIVDNVRGVAEFNYFFKKDYVSYWNLEANVEYLFRLAGNKVILYPLAGLDFLGTSVEHGGSTSKLGLNLGAGVEFPISGNFALKAEYNYKTQYDGWSLLKLGVVIPF
jgi:opacity protein-like surface antigen